MTDWTKYPNFSRSEFECKCGRCGLASMDDDFMAKLQQLRTDLDFPFAITSGYRCHDHNEAVKGGVAHRTGKAVDIAVRGRSAFLIVAKASQHGFTGIGVKQSGGPRFVHLDSLLPNESGAPRPWIWSY